MSTRYSSVYHTDTKTLSEEALYRAKQKYGLHQPAKTDLGVDSYAPDTAALLASNSDLKVHAYVAPEFKEAATAAKAVRAVSSGVQPVQPPRQPDQNARRAATSVRASKPSAEAAPTPAPTPAFNIQAITARATSGAAKSLTSASAAPSRTTTLNVAQLSAVAQQSAQRQIDDIMRHKKRSQGIPTRSDGSVGGQFAGEPEGNNGGKSEARDLSHVNSHVNSHVGQNVLALATQRANSTLKDIDNSVVSRGHFSTQSLSQKALDLARRRAREATGEAPRGEVNLGGGLFMSAAEIEKLAASVVRPALEEIDGKAAQQRAEDHKMTQVLENVRIRKVERKEELRKEREAERILREKESGVRREGLEKDKGVERGRQEEMLAGFRDEKETKEGEFEAQVAAEEKAAGEVDEERAQKLQVWIDAKVEKDSERSGEIAELKAAQKEELAPILAELAKEKEVLAGLVSEREEKESFFNGHKSRVSAADAEIAKVEAQLAKLSAQYTRISEELAEVQAATTASLSQAAKVQEESEAQLAADQSALEAHLAHRKSLEQQVESAESSRVNLLERQNTVLEQNHQSWLEVNTILPDHLRRELPEFKPVKDTLHLSRYAVDDSSIVGPADVSREQLPTPEQIWSQEREEKERLEKERKAAEKFQPQQRKRTGLLGILRGKSLRRRDKAEQIVEAKKTPRASADVSRISRSSTRVSRTSRASAEISRASAELSRPSVDVSKSADVKEEEAVAESVPAEIPPEISEAEKSEPAPQAAPQISEPAPQISESTAPQSFNPVASTGTFHPPQPTILPIASTPSTHEITSQIKFRPKDPAKAVQAAKEKPKKKSRMDKFIKFLTEPSNPPKKKQRASRVRDVPMKSVRKEEVVDDNFSDFSQDFVNDK